LAFVQVVQLSYRQNKLNLKMFYSKYRTFSILFCVLDVSGRQKWLQGTFLPWLMDIGESIEYIFEEQI